MKRILLLNYEFPPLGGGASPVSFGIAMGLSKTGNFDIDVVTMGYKGLPAFEEINNHFRIHRVKCVRKRKEICQPWEQATYLVSALVKSSLLISRKHFDLCHTHFIIPTGILALTLKKLFHLNYIVTAHGSDVPKFNPDRFIFAHKFTKPLLNTVLCNADKVVTGSQYLANLIHNTINPLVKIHVINQGISITKSPILPKEKIILSSGRLLRRKGFHYLINLMKSHTSDYEIHICGDGPMRNTLEKMAQSSKTKIIFHGWLNNNSQYYKKLLQRASIFCLLSERENASVALLEAMNAGCAIVTTRTPGCIELTADAGILLSLPPNPQSKKRFYSLLTDSEQLKQYQTASKNRVAEFYNINSTIHQYAKLLK